MSWAAMIASVNKKTVAVGKDRSAPMKYEKQANKKSINIHIMSIMNPNNKYTKNAIDANNVITARKIALPKIPNNIFAKMNITIPVQNKKNQITKNPPT